MPPSLGGTLNVPGLAGLAAGIRFLRAAGCEEIEARESSLRDRLYAGLSEIPGVKIYAPEPGRPAGCVLSFTIRGIDPGEISAILDSSFDIAVRAGLHCAPYAHRMLGTIGSGGTVRVSPNHFSTPEEIDSFLDAVRQIAEAARR